MRLHWLVSIVPGISWAVSQLKKRKVFIQPAGGFFKPAIVIASSLSMFSFLPALIDTPLQQRHNVMSLDTLCEFERPGLFSADLLPVLKIGELERSYITSKVNSSALKLNDSEYWFINVASLGFLHSARVHFHMFYSA